MFLVATLVCAWGEFGGLARQQTAPVYEKKIPAHERQRVRVTNLRGRVTIVASADARAAVTVRASAAPDEQAGAVGESEIKAGAAATGTDIIEISVTAPPSSNGGGGARSQPRRIDLIVQVPARSRVEATTSDGAIDIGGDVEEASAQTVTGTIRADVPSEALDYKFTWTASRPRVFSELELSPIKERAGGKFEVAGHLGEKEAKGSKDVSRVRLNLTTERGIVLLGVAPEMVPTDLRERKLTEAARLIVKQGDPELSEAVRKVSPRLFRDYVKELPDRRGAAPSLVARSEAAAPLTVETRTADDLRRQQTTVRLNVTVTDRLGRAVSDLSARDFQIYENNQLRPVDRVEPSTAPFNLVLLLDVSGSVEERLDFIRRAARSFIDTARPTDRIAVLSFRDDVQLISNFSTDRARLRHAVDQIEAGGATTLYDSLTYALLETLRPLRGERTAVVVLSDGDDNRSFVPFPLLLQTVVESGAIIYPLYVPSGLIAAEAVARPADAVDPLRSKLFTLTTRAESEGKRLAAESGGVFYPITRLDDLQAAYRDIISQLRTSYSVTYVSDRPDARARRVRVRIADRADAAVRLSPAVQSPIGPGGQ